MDNKKKRLLLQNRQDLITQLYQGKLYKVLKLFLKFIWLIHKLINQKKRIQINDNGQIETIADWI
jgi:flagellar biogenesis protein FliO